MKRDAGVNAVFLLRKKTAITPASLFILGRRTDVTVLATANLSKFALPMYETERLFGLFFLIPLMHYSLKKNRRSAVGFGMN